jgi:hypothetical protein
MENYRKIKQEMKELYEKITSEENTKNDIDKYFELKEQLSIAANEYKLHLGDISDSWIVAKTVNSGQYHTQGFGATKYARGNIKLSQLKFQQLGIPSKIEESLWCYNQKNWGGQFNENCHTTFTLFVKCSKELSNLILLRSINMNDYINCCVENRVNPLVY